MTNVRIHRITCPYEYCGNRQPHCGLSEFSKFNLQTYHNQQLALFQVHMQSPAKKHATKRPAATSNGVTKRRKNRKALTNISNKSKQWREICEKSAAISSRSHANRHKHLPDQKEDHSYNTSKLSCEKDGDTR